MRRRAGRLVPRLADRGEYIGSESTMYRVLRERGQAGRRGRAKAPRPSRPPTTHRAAGPCEVWSWDITWLPGPALGIFFHLYLILDIWSRKITGWEVHDRENGELAAQVIERTDGGQGDGIGRSMLHEEPHLVIGHMAAGHGRSSETEKAPAYPERRFPPLSGKLSPCLKPL